MTVDLHRPGSAPDEAPFTRRCEVCGMAWPCPERKAQLHAEAEEMKAARVDEAHRIGIMTLIDRGVTVWSCERRDARDEALGGVVVEITDDVDRETGEVVRTFTCLDPYGGGPVKVRHIAENEVRQSGIEATDGARLTRLVKRLAAELAARPGSYLDPWAAERVRWMYVLTGLSNLAA